MNNERYSRQILLSTVGVRGQQRLNKASVLVIGAGGLGSPALLYLAAAGIGKIGVVDEDTVAISNLNRQVLYSSADQGTPKANSARSRLLDLNPEIEVQAIPIRWGENPSQTKSLIEQYDVIVDGSDNFDTKFLLNDYCLELKKPWVYGSILQFDGQLAVFDPRQNGPCYRCLYPLPPQVAIPNCAEAGVVGALAGIIGSAQALEAIKLVLNNDQLKPLSGRLALFSGATFEWSVLQLPAQPQCICRSSHFQVKHSPAHEHAEISTEALRNRMSLKHSLENASPTFRLIDVRELHEIETHGTLTGAIPWSMSQFHLGNLPPLHAGDTILFCEGGTRSAQALQRLKQAGHQNLFHLAGGHSKWREEESRR